VDNGVEGPALSLVGKDDAAEGVAVEGAIVAEDVTAEMGGDLIEGLAPWLDGFASEDVEIDDGDAVGLEEGRDGRLACRASVSVRSSAGTGVEMGARGSVSGRTQAQGEKRRDDGTHHWRYLPSDQ
jgi:hypothetical protein